MLLHLHFIQLVNRLHSWICQNAFDLLQQVRRQDQDRATAFNRVEQRLGRAICLRVSSHEDRRIDGDPHLMIVADELDRLVDSGVNFEI